MYILDEISDVSLRCVYAKAFQMLRQEDSVDAVSAIERRKRSQIFPVKLLHAAYLNG